MRRNYGIKVIDDQVHNMLTASLQMAESFDVVVAGYQCEHIVHAAQKIPRAEQVYYINDVLLQDGLAEPTAEALLTLITDYDYILFANNTTTKNILPRLASLADISPITDVCEIVKPGVFKRPIYAGNIIETIQSEQKIKILSIRAASFAKTPFDSDSLANIKNVTPQLLQPRSKFIKSKITKLDRPDLTSAKIVISGGRGLGSKESFQLVYQLADQLGAAVGASRAAVDAEFVSNDYQVGQTGKIIAPDVYFAIGISGAIQHMAGMKDSRVIIAINKDADAPIFQSCDYGLVADLFVAVPKILEHIKK